MGVAMSSVIIRIALRYVAAALVSHGLLSADMSDFAYDPDIAEMVQVGAGIATAAAAEGWYYFARKFGWAK
jgi:hypothetical protein